MGGPCGPPFLVVLDERVLEQQLSLRQGEDCGANRLQHKDWQHKGPWMGQASLVLIQLTCH